MGTAKKRDIVIAGYSETPIGFKTGRSAYDLAGEALAELLAATRIEKDVIDGMSVTAPLSECPNPFFAVYMAEALGLTPTWLNYGGIGGCSATGGVARAASAIRDGMCEVALVHIGGCAEHLMARQLRCLSFRISGSARRAGSAGDVRAVDEPLPPSVRHQVAGAGQDRHHPAPARAA